jgi:iron complex outermembrane receptor protein
VGRAEAGVRHHGIRQRLRPTAIAGTQRTGWPSDRAGNKHNGRVSGLEVGAHYEPSASWQLFGGYTRLFERFDFDADSRDPTGGSLEHNDPAHQVLVRSYSDLPRGFSFDAVARWVSALPRPAVPAYGDVDAPGGASRR